MTDHLVLEHPMAAANESTAVFRTGSWRFERPVFIERTAPCTEACPLGEDIPNIMSLHSQGLHREALDKILEENPLPGFCAQACFHPCEKVCNRGRFDQAVSIQDLERFAVEHFPGGVGRDVRPQGARSPRTAVLGGGPEGVSCAWFLARLGHKVTLYQPGDRLEIYRILSDSVPEALLKNEEDRLAEIGIEIITGFSPDSGSLIDLSKRFDGLYISTSVPGISHSLDLREPAGRLFTLRGLREAQKAGRPPVLSGTVAIAGGGSSALEAAQLVLDQGGLPKVFCGSSQTRDPEAAEAEGIELYPGSGIRGVAVRDDGLRVFTTAPPGLSGSNDGLAAVKAPDADALILVSALKGTQPEWIPHILPSGLVTIREASSPSAENASRAQRARRAVKGLASGKRAALILDLSLTGRPLHLLENTAVGKLGALSAEAYSSLANMDTRRRLPDVVRYEDLNIACFETLPRSKSSSREDLTPGQAVYSARRCFNCGSCTFCGVCEEYCPDVSIRIDRENRMREIDYDHCKGCGICARECPRGAIVMEKENV